MLMTVIYPIVAAHRQPPNNCSASFQLPHVIVTTELQTSRLTSAIMIDSDVVHMCFACVVSVLIRLFSDNVSCA